MRPSFIRYAVALIALAVLPGAAGAQEGSSILPKGSKVTGGLPQFQRAAQSLEEARALLDLAGRKTQAENREAVRGVLEQVDAALADVNAALARAKVERTTAPGKAAPADADRPLAAARAALIEAEGQLSGVAAGVRDEARSPLGKVRQATRGLDKVAGVQPQERPGGNRRPGEGNRQEKPAPAPDPAPAPVPAPVPKGDETIGRGSRGGPWGASSSRLAGLPLAVRETVEANAPGLRVREVKREGEGGGEKGITYKIEGTGDDGKVEMHVAENGDLLKLDRKGGGGDDDEEGGKGKDKKDKKEKKDKDD
jgi:hypothetical protein